MYAFLCTCMCVSVLQRPYETVVFGGKFAMKKRGMAKELTFLRIDPVHLLFCCLTNFKVFYNTFPLSLTCMLVLGTSVLIEKIYDKNVC